MKKVGHMRADILIRIFLFRLYLIAPDLKIDDSYTVLNCIPKT